jgi:neurofibromin 1
VKKHLELLLQLLARRNIFVAQHRDKSVPLHDIPDRHTCVTRIETALLISLCSADTEVCSLAILCLQELCIECTMAEEVEDPTQQPYAVPSNLLGNVYSYRAFLSAAYGGGMAVKMVTGRVAQQKKIRRMLRTLEKATNGVLAAWEEGYRRWVALSPVMSKPTEEGSLDVRNFAKSVRH